MGPIGVLKIHSRCPTNKIKFLYTEIHIFVACEYVICVTSVDDKELQYGS